MKHIDIVSFFPISAYINVFHLKILKASQTYPTKLLYLVYLTCRYQNLGEMMTLGRNDASISPSFIDGLTLEGPIGHAGTIA